jgi:hypothetical protein
MTNDKFHAHYNRFSPDYHQYAHKLGIHDSKSQSWEVNSITNSVHTLNRLKISISLKGSLSRF